MRIGGDRRLPDRPETSTDILETLLVVTGITGKPTVETIDIDGPSAPQAFIVVPDAAA